MHVIAEEPWVWMLFEEGQKQYLSVACGSVGIFTTDIALSQDELVRVVHEGRTFISLLAAQVHNNPAHFASRHIKAFHVWETSKLAAAAWRAKQNDVKGHPMRQTDAPAAHTSNQQQATVSQRMPYTDDSGYEPKTRIHDDHNVGELEKMTRFGCGAALGVLVGLIIIFFLALTSFGVVAAVLVLSIICFGLIALIYGDRFWHALIRWIKLWIPFWF